MPSSASSNAPRCLLISCITPTTSMPAFSGIASMLFVRKPVFLSCSWLNLSSL